MNNYFHLALEFVQGYGLAGVFGIMVLENVGLPIPTEPGYIVAINLVLKKDTNWTIIFLVIMSGQLIGSIISYYFGRLGIVFIHHSHIAGLKRAQKTLEHWYKYFGDWIIFLARIIGYVRPWSSFFAGAANARISKFIGLTLIGTVIHVILSIYATIFLFNIWSKYPALHLLIALTMLFLIFGGLIYAQAHQAIKKRKLKKIL